MDPKTRALAKWIVGGVCLLWMALAGWLQFSDLSENEIQTHASTAVKERMRDCEGTFQQRYECKEAIVIQSSRETFYTVTIRIIIVALPPILLGVAFPFMFPRRRPVIHRQVEDDDAWKQRAQSHIIHPHQPPAGDNQA